MFWHKGGHREIREDQRVQVAPGEVQWAAAGSKGHGGWCPALASQVRRGGQEQGVKAVACCLIMAAQWLQLRAVGSHVAGSHRDWRVPSRVLEGRDQVCKTVCVPHSLEYCGFHSWSLITSPCVNHTSSTWLGTVGKTAH